MLTPALCRAEFHRSLNLSSLFDRLAPGYRNLFKFLYDVFRLCATYHDHKDAFATSETCSNCLYALIKFLYCEVNCLPFTL